MAKLIVGCGYLGQRVGRIWLQQGETVYAMTRTAEQAAVLAKVGFHPIVGDITQPETLVGLPEVDTVLMAVGMDRSMYSDIEMVYVDGLKNLLDSVTWTPRHFVYVSSTGVYGDFGGAWVDEKSPTLPLRPGGKACLKAEQLLRESRLADRVSILRFAGIYGDGRVPTRQTIESGKWSKLATAGYLNLIHVDDGAAIVDRVAGKTPLGETYIVSDGSPVLRREYYQRMAELLQVDQIEWAETVADPKSARSGSSKRVSNQKLLDWLGEFEFTYPDYRLGLKQAVGQ